MTGRVIWITGLSGAGKTTLCGAVREALQARGVHVLLLDGDNVREALGSDLGYTEADRIRHNQRMQRLARLLAEQGATILVGAAYSNPDLLAWNRTHLPNYCEVFLDASLDALTVRDPKGLYARYAEGRLTNMVGLDIPFTAPAQPDLVFHTDRFEAVGVMADAVIRHALGESAAPR